MLLKPLDALDGRGVIVERLDSAWSAARSADIELSENLQTMSTNINIYVTQMAEVRHRLGLVQAVLAGSVRTGHQAFDAELIFVQLRKALELIAFGSLCANRQKFSPVYEKFADQWSAKRLFRDNHSDISPL